MATAVASEQVGDPEMVSLPATPRGPSTPEPRGTPARRVVDGLRGYLEEVGHLTRLDPRDAWLPVTESRGGNACYAAFHSLNAGLGFQALLLPLAFPALGWSANAITASTPLHSSSSYRFLIMSCAASCQCYALLRQIWYFFPISKFVTEK
jgi:hypothetical protein